MECSGSGEHDIGQEAIRCVTPLPGLHDRGKVWQVERKLEAGFRSPESGTSEIRDRRSEDGGWRIELENQRMESVRSNQKEAE
jgi:hypothetical protein